MPSSKMLCCDFSERSCQYCEMSCGECSIRMREPLVMQRSFGLGSIL